jgi:hypothetical protein
MKYNINRILNKGKHKNPVTRHIRITVDCEMTGWNGAGEEILEPLQETQEASFGDEVLDIFRDKIKEYYEEKEGLSMRILECPSSNELELSWLREGYDDATNKLDKLCWEYYKMCGWLKYDDTKQIRADDVRERYTAEDLLERYGYEITRKKVQCISPEHDDSNPSMQVYAYSVYCFSCSAHYDTIAIIQLIEGCTFKEALNILNR